MPSAEAGTATVSGGPGLTINDRGPSDPGPAPATPYPSTLNVSGLSGPAHAVTVTVFDFNHTCPQDVTLMLVDPFGGTSTLMGDGGDCSGLARPNATVTFDNLAPSKINCVDSVATPSAVAPVSGTYRPGEADGRGGPNDCGGDSFWPGGLPAPAPSGPYGGALTNFVSNQNPNGTWQLYATDDETGDSGSIGGWSLSFTIAPPVNMGGVTISGRATKGGTLTVTNPGNWFGAPGSFSYQWERRQGFSGPFQPIPGQTGQSYTLTRAEVGGFVGVLVTGTNSGGSATTFAGGPLIGPPVLKFAKAKPQRILKQRGVRLSVRSNMNGQVAASGTIAVPGASRVVRLKSVKKRLITTRAINLTLKLPRAGSAGLARALARGAKLKAKITITAADDSGGRETVRRTVPLKP